MLEGRAKEYRSVTEFGQEMMAIAEDGKFKGVSYMWPKPGSRTPAGKISFITKFANQVCGVGYYR